MRKPVFVALAAAVLIMLPGVAAHAQTYTDTTVYSFGATPTDGISPFGGLIIDAQGNLYGTTWSGGGSSNCSPFKGCGTVFKLDSSGNETILHTFTGITDGAGPFGSLTMDKGGNLYGTTSAGGGPKNAGTVFKLTATGAYSILHAFGGFPTDGAAPAASLQVDGAGNLYGTAPAGGTHNFGMIFRLNAKGTETILYNFTGKTDGAYPSANLIRDPAGDLYGTANAGGAFGGGVMFKLSSQSVLDVMHSFCSLPACADGQTPFYIVRTAQGNFYGGTESGGTSNQGVIFEVNSKGTESTLRSFCAGGEASGCPDGSDPVGILLASGKQLYGTAATGGNGAGLVFKLTPAGVETVLFSFPGDFSEGASPIGVILDSAGNFYGTALNGGSENSGDVFKLTKNQ